MTNFSCRNIANNGYEKRGVETNVTGKKSCGLTPKY